MAIIRNEHAEIGFYTYKREILERMVNDFDYYMSRQLELPFKDRTIASRALECFLTQDKKFNEMLIVAFENKHKNDPKITFIPESKTNTETIE